MVKSALDAPQVDPTPIFEAFRGSYGTELLAVAVAHLNVFRHLADAPLSFERLCEKMELAPRAGVVLTTALRAQGMLQKDADGNFALTELAREHLVPGAAFEVSDYLGLAAESPGVLEMLERLRTNRPAGADADEGATFIYRDGIESAMEAEASARHLTLALCGRAKNVAPVLAQRAELDDAKLLLDVGGGTGIYAIACLQKHPNLRAVVLDRPEVLKVAAEFAEEYGVSDRLELQPSDMFTDEFPAGADAILLSNILHDWDVPECEQLVQRCAEALVPGGRLLIHDVFLNDELDGPLPIALYSAALFSLTEGRAYSAAEYRNWLSAAGLAPQECVPTLVHCGILAGRKG
jgi:predicted O-methyltransferase YrrM